MPDDFDYSLPRKARARQSVDQPIITMLLIGLSVAFTAAFWYSQNDKSSPITGIANIGVVSAWEIWDGKYWGLITSMFPHVNVVHILFNMMWTWKLGAAIEKEMHPIAYLLFIVAAAVLGSGVQICVAGETGIGMSGVVYAMFGLMWAGRGSSVMWRSIANRDTLNLFVGWGVLCIITTYFGIMNVGNGAHFGGLLFGLCVGFLWYSPRRRPIFAAPLALLCIATVLAVTWVPWSGSWQWWRGNRDLRNGDMVTALDHYQLGVKLMGPDEPLLHNVVIAWTDQLAIATQNHDTAGIAHAQTELQKAKADLDGFMAIHPSTSAGKGDSNSNGDQ